MAITKQAVDAASPREKVWFLWDDGRAAIPGFGLRISPGGAKSYVMQYRMKGATTDRRYTIGRHGAYTPDQARERAGELYRAIKSGTDPFDDDAAKAAVREQDRIDKLERAFGIVADRWLESYKIDRHGNVRRLSSVQIAATVVRHLKSQFGEKRIDRIGRADVTSALDAISPHKVAMRSSIFSYGRILWKWAFARELVTSLPFSELSAPPKPVRRKRMLSDIELAVFWRASHEVSYPFGPAFRLMLLTGQRRSEVFGMAWEELDLEKAIWTIPGSRTKNKLPHSVPLTELVISEISVIASMVRSGNPDRTLAGLLFTTNGRTPSSGISRAKARLDAVANDFIGEGRAFSPWRLHDLRRTAKTGMQRLGVSGDLSSRVLNHISALDEMDRTYGLHDFDGEKRDALNRWNMGLIWWMLCAGTVAHHQRTAHVFD